MPGEAHRLSLTKPLIRVARTGDVLGGLCVRCFCLSLPAVWHSSTVMCTTNTQVPRCQSDQYHLIVWIVHISVNVASFWLVPTWWYCVHLEQISRIAPKTPCIANCRHLPSS